MGTIEQGRRFTFIDLSGGRRAHRSLGDAQSAATAAAFARSSSTWTPGRYSRREKRLMIGSAIVLVVTAALLVTAFLLLV